MGGEHRKIVFFDGVCNLCNGFVDFMVRRQSQPNIVFAPLQGQTADALLGEIEASQLSSVIYYRDKKILKNSTAALSAIADLGGLWLSVRLLLIVPQFVRDPVYKWVARNRYGWFGRRDSCRLPSESEKPYFLS